MDPEGARRVALVCGLAAGFGAFVAVAPLLCGPTYDGCRGLLAFHYPRPGYLQPAVAGAVVGGGTALVVWLMLRRPSFDRGERVVLGVLLGLVTAVMLISIGGGMAYAFPFLLPLHWYAARQAGRWTTGLWTALAALSAAEAGFMYQYMLVSSVSWVVPVLVPCAVIVVFVATTPPRRL